MSESKTDAAPSTAEPKKRRSKLLLIGVPMFLLLMAGGGGGWWYFSQSAAAADATEHKEEGEEHKTAGLVSLDPFIVNLADPGGRKYLRMTVVLLLPDEHMAKEVEENKLTISRVRSAIIEVLTSRTSLELASPDGRAALKKTIAETATNVGHIDVRDVLFEEFIVQ